MSVFFYLVKFSCQNTIFLFKKMPMRIMRQEWKKKCRKVKKIEKYQGPGKVLTIFPHLICFLHFSTARLRLGQDLGGVSS